MTVKKEIKSVEDLEALLLDISEKLENLLQDVRLQRLVDLTCVHEDVQMFCDTIIAFPKSQTGYLLRDMENVIVILNILSQQMEQRHRSLKEMRVLQESSEKKNSSQESFSGVSVKPPILKSEDFSHRDTLQEEVSSETVASHYANMQKKLQQQMYKKED